MITEKENYMRVYRGEMPEWVPRMYVKSPDHPQACTRVMPKILQRTKGMEGFDIWGLEYVGTAEMGGAALPVPGKYLIEDITKWRNVLHAPDLSNVDWAAMAEEDLKGIDRENTAVMLNLHNGYFQALVNMMGYVEGCCAFYEEPDEVKAMLNYLCDFYCQIAEKSIQYYKPDIYNLTDDICTKDHPFISQDVYEEFIFPCTKREAKYANDAGIPIDMHCCGSCEVFIPDWLSIGVRSWQPAQVMNDLDGIRKKYPDLIFTGCWNSQGGAGLLSATDKEIEVAVKDCIDHYAKDGKFIFWASTYGRSDDSAYLKQSAAVTKYYDIYGRNFYKKNEQAK